MTIKLDELETKIINGYVAKILNSRELVINKGKENGVTTGLIFTIYDKTTEKIKDPVTGKVIGSIKRPKVEVKVNYVEDNLCIAETYKTKTINVGGHGADIVGVAKMFQPPKYIEKYETLKTNEKTWEDIDETNSFVKTGDPVEAKITTYKSKKNETSV